jgi:fumarate reductase (CoM/CoB) subunit A
MSLLSIKRIETDVLIIGAGGAGCFAAITAADRGAKVLVLNKVPWLGGCTMIARAGYSAAMGTTAPQDTADIHFHDTVRGGDYMGNQKFLKAVCHKNVEATNALLKWGAAFRTGPDGRLDLGKVPNAGHTYPRAVRVAGEFSHIGKVIMDLLQPRIRERGIAVIGNVMVTRLLTSRGTVTGALGFDWRSGSLYAVSAKAVIMATGGTGRLYRYTDNPTFMTGDGHAVMAEAGAELVDMEFCDFQLAAFYPPQIFGYPPNCTGWLMAGGILLNRNGERFFKKYFPGLANEGECLRTELNKAAAWEILEGRGSDHGMVYLNCSAVPREWMMTARADMVSHFKRAGIDLTWQPMEVAPANHTCLGGMRVDENAESTTIRGLYAAGEAAGGWGGSNRLGGNALAATFGSGIIAGESAAARSRNVSRRRIEERQVAAEEAKIAGLLERRGGVKARKIKERVQSLVQEHLWLKRDAKGLGTALEKLQDIAEKDLPGLAVPPGRETARLLGVREALEAANLVRCGRLVAAAALARMESRGSHQRVDYPDIDNRNWLKNIVVRCDKGAVKVHAEPVVVTEVPLPKAERRGRPPKNPGSGSRKRDRI